MPIRNALHVLQMMPRAGESRRPITTGRIARVQSAARVHVSPPAVPLGPT